MTDEEFKTERSEITGGLRHRMTVFVEALFGELLAPTYRERITAHAHREFGSAAEINFPDEGSVSLRCGATTVSVGPGA